MTLCLLVLLCASCRTVPPSLPPAAAAAIPARYAASLPVCFDARQTLVFEFRPHWWWPTIRFTALGYTTVDGQSGDYAVACLSPLGMKLFDVVRSNGQVRTNITIPLPGAQAAASQAIAADIADIYFDLTPPPEAAMSRRGDQIVFRHTAGPQSMEYVFSSDNGQLLRKTRYDARRCVSIITFSDYRTEEGRTYPATSILDNRRYRYRLTLKVREMRIP